VEDDPQNAALVFDLVLTRTKLVVLASEEKDGSRLREHLRSADTLLDQMEARGQLNGFAERAAVRADINTRLGKSSR